MTRLFNKTGECLFVLFVLLIALPSTSSFSADLNADNLYDPNVVLDISVDLSADDWSALCKQTRDPGKAFTGEQENPFTWFSGTITINGTKVESVGVRKKGFLGSLDDHYPSLKIDFSEYVKQDPIDGIGSLTLNNNKQDESLLSQYLAYRLFNQAGIQAPRCNFARVTVNGEYLGLYSNVESINEAFLKRRFGDASGNLYEGTLTDFHPKATDKLEAKTNKKKDNRKTIKTLAKLLNQDGAVDTAQIEQIVDTDNFLRYWALESLIEFWDGYSNNQNNFWVYEDTKTHKLKFIPWGADAAFSTMRNIPMFGPQGPVSVYSQGALANRLYRDDKFAARYRETMLVLLKDVWNEESLLAESKRMRLLLKKDLHPRQKQMSQASKRLEKFIQTRRDKIEKELDAWPVKIADRPRKPAYTVKIGQAKGSFSTLWSDQPTSDVAEQDTMDMKLSLRDKDIHFKQQSATLYKHPEASFSFFGFGGPTTEPKPTVDLILAAIREDNNKPIRMTFNIDQGTLLDSVGKSIDVGGMYFEGELSAFGFPPRDSKMIRGQLELSKANNQTGDVVEGTFDLAIIEVHGGFFDQFQQNPGGPMPAPGTSTQGQPPAEHQNDGESEDKSTE